jgi:hypothetical protein
VRLSSSSGGAFDTCCGQIASNIDAALAFPPLKYSIRP